MSGRHAGEMTGDEPMAERRSVPRWPLLIIALPAATAVWSGWVGLAALCGFGLIEPLPGIAPWHLNTAITLPVGVEAYGSYALMAWLSPWPVSDRARAFARRSAIGSLVLGCIGQVSFHLLAARHATHAPAVVVVLVACMPVVTLGFGVALTHLLRAPGPHPDRAPEPQPEPDPKPAPVRTRTRSRSAPARRTRSAPATAQDAEAEFMAELASGTLPSQRQIRERMHVGQDRAREFRAHLEAVSSRT